MSLRIREDGTVLCAAMHKAEPGDRYLDDAQHYRLSAELGMLVTEPMELLHIPGTNRGGHQNHGQWWWRSATPPDVRPDYWVAYGRRGAEARPLGVASPHAAK
jgi:hypothetical protein